MRKKREKAKGYFERARAGAEDQGAEVLLRKIDAACCGFGSPSLVPSVMAFH